MSAAQVLRAAFVKQWEGCSYPDLAFHIIDSRSYRNFCRIGITHKGFKKSVLCKNIKALSPETWEMINHCIVQYAQDNGIEKGRQVRIDCIVVESNIHVPSDSTLLGDSVRVLTRILTKNKKHFPLSGGLFHDDTQKAKQRLLTLARKQMA